MYFLFIYSTIFVQLYMFRKTISFIIRCSWFTVSADQFSPKHKTKQLGTFVCFVTELQNTVNHELIMVNEMAVRNTYSCTEIVE
jgi:hypothetical protein